MQQRSDNKICSITLKTFQTSRPVNLRTFLHIQRHRSTRSSACHTLSRPPCTPVGKAINCSFRHAVPVVWNNMPLSPTSVFTFRVRPFYLTTSSCLRQHLLQTKIPLLSRTYPVLLSSAQPPWLTPYLRYPIRLCRLRYRLFFGSGFWKVRWIELIRLYPHLSAV